MKRGGSDVKGRLGYVRGLFFWPTIICKICDVALVLQSVKTPVLDQRGL